MHFDLVDLRLFLLVADGGSITAGAARAGLALPSASARVANMEARAGVRLLERGRRGVRPTAAGLVLQRHAREVLDGVERLRAALGAFGGAAPAGVVRLLANTAGAAAATERLALFLRRHPAVDVALEERRSEAVARGVRDGEAELGLAAGHADAAGLAVRPAGTDRLVLALPPGHALVGHALVGHAPVEHAMAGGGGVRLAAALGEGFVGLGRGSALQAHVEEQARRGGTAMRVRVQAAGAAAALRLVALGVGPAVVPVGAATAECRVVPLLDPWAERRLLLLARGFGEALSPPARLLAALLSEPPPLGEEGASQLPPGAAGSGA